MLIIALNQSLNEPLTQRTSSRITEMNECENPGLFHMFW